MTVPAPPSPVSPRRRTVEVLALAVERRSPPAWRALLVGALLIPLSALFGIYSYEVVQALHWTMQSLKCGPIFVLFLVMVGNLTVRRFARRFALTQAELILVYAMVVTATAIGGVASVQHIVAGLAAPYYFADETNRWREFFPFIPKPLTPHDPEVISQFYKGNASIYRLAVLRDWAIPVISWTAFLLLLFVTSLSVNALLRRRWVEGERLTFPLVVLPLEMTRAGGEGPFWRSRLMWMGFLLAGGLESIDFLNYMYPSLPYIQIKAYHIEHYFPDRPWNGIESLVVAFYPLMIGIVYLLPLDVSLSCWFFYLLVKAQMVFATAVGWKDADAGPVAARAPYISEQGAGAFLGVALFVLWTARGHLRETLRAALRSGHRARDEILSPRAAWLGVLGGFGGMVLCLHAVGMSAWLAALLFLVYLLFLVTITRIVAEAGAGWHYGPNYTAHSLIFDLFGQRGWDHRNLMMLGYTQWLTMDLRDNPMPYQLEAMKMGQSSGLEPRRLLAALLLAAALGAVAAFWANLTIYYHYGAASAKVRPWVPLTGQLPFLSMRTWIDSPQLPDSTFAGGMSLGFLAVALLGLARQRFAGWPLHPLGYALANTDSMEYMWLPFLMGWALKATMLRYGGIRLYRAALPFFLGLILGDYVVPAFWSLYGMITGQQMYMAFPH
jgi:hypothetical protein